MTHDVDPASRVTGTLHTADGRGIVRMEDHYPTGIEELTMDPGQPEATVIEADLSPEVEGTRLTVEERGLPLAELAAHGAGWQAHIEDLRGYLSGREHGDWQARWLELTPAYRRRVEDLKLAGG